MKNYIHVCFLLMFVIVIAACSDDSEVEQTVEGDTETDVSNEDNDLVIGMRAEMVTLDPHGSNDNNSGNIRRNIYEPLIMQGTDMSLNPGLADEWENVEDDVWNFKLREGTTFHEGSEFNAEDVKATFDRVLDPALASQVHFLYEMITEVEIVDDYEINIHTDFPFAPLPSHLAHNTAGIMSKDLIDRDYQEALDAAESDMTLDEYYTLRDEGGEEFDEVAEAIGEHLGEVIAAEPDGTNHLKFVERNPGESVELESFEDFQAGNRNFNNVTFRVIPEDGSRIGDLETGGIQIAANIEPSHADRVDSHDDTTLVQNESVRMSYLSFNTEKEPFDDADLRRAIAHSIDREEIISGLYNGMAIEANGPLAPDVWGHDESLEGVSHNPDVAEEYMAESSVPDGFDTTIWVSDSDIASDTAVYIQEALGNLNINAEIELLEHGAFLDRASNGEHEMFILNWGTVTGDADYGLYALFHSDSHGSTGNRSFYSNPEVDELLDAGRTETDDDERFEIYSELQEVLAEDSPLTPMYYANSVVGVNTSQVDNVVIDPVGYIRFEEATFN